MNKRFALMTLLAATCANSITLTSAAAAASAELSDQTGTTLSIQQKVSVDPATFRLVEKGRDRLLQIRNGQTPEAANKISTIQSELAGYHRYDAASNTSEFAFRGTCNSLWQDALNASLTSATSLGLEGRIHSGIAAIASQLQLDTAITQHLEMLLTTVNDLNAVNFQLHGDSLGGSMALLTALKLSERLKEFGVQSPQISVITYGAPYMFDTAAATDYLRKMEHTQILRFEGEKDFFAINGGAELKKWVQSPTFDSLCKELSDMLSIFRSIRPDSRERHTPIPETSLDQDLPQILKEAGQMLKLEANLVDSINVASIVRVILSSEKFETSDQMKHVGTLIRLSAQNPKFTAELPSNLAGLGLLATGIREDHDLRGVYKKALEAISSSTTDVQDTLTN